MDGRNNFDNVIGACEALAGLLRDEHRPGDGLCVICFGCIPRLLGLDGPEIVRLRTRNHDLWDACMRTLTVPRSASQDAVLRQRLQDNIDRCPYREPENPHDDLSVFYISDPVQKLRVVISHYLSNCLYGVDNASGNRTTVVNRTDHAHKRFRSVSQAWPSRVDQLFPYGPERTVSALIDDCCAFSDTSALWVLNAILRLARPLVWDVILQPDNCIRLSWYITAVLFLGVSDDLEHIEKLATLAPPGCSLPQYVADVEWTQTGEEADSVIAFINTIRLGPYAHPDDPSRFATACGEPMSRRLRAAMHAAAEHHKPTMYRRWSAFQRYLSRLEAHAAAGARVPYADLVAHVERNPRDTTLLRIVRLALGELPADRRCAGPGCTRTMFDLDEGADRPLATCARCRLRRYCCRECQRADWRAGHRALCRVLATLAEVAPTSLPSDEFVRRVQQSTIADTDLLALGMWVLGRGQYMRDLLACNISFPHLRNLAANAPAQVSSENTGVPVSA